MKVLVIDQMPSSKGGKLLCPQCKEGELYVEQMMERPVSRPILRGGMVGSDELDAKERIDCQDVVCNAGCGALFYLHTEKELKSGSLLHVITWKKM